jgi:hypothetical protein
MDAAELLSSLGHERHRTSRRVGAGDLDVLLTPSLGQRPVAIGEINACSDDPMAAFRASGRFTPYAAIWNVTGQPAMTVPLFQGGDGMPLMVQIVGRPVAEATLLSLAAQLEEVRPWMDRLPSLASPAPGERKSSTVQAGEAVCCRRSCAMTTANPEPRLGKPSRDNSKPGMEVGVIVTGELPMPHAFFRPEHGNRLSRFAAVLRPGGEMLRAPCLGYAVRHPSEGTLLIDTGFHRDASENRRRDFGMRMAFFFRNLRPADQPFDEQLIQLGIEPEEVERWQQAHTARVSTWR